MDININVRMQKYTGTATSANKSVTDKQSKTSPAKKSEAVSTKTGKDKLAMNASEFISKKFIPAAKAAISVVAAAKAINTINRIEGSISGNRFRERRRSDFLRTATRPLSTVSTIVSTSFDRYFEMNREMEQMQYRRGLAGLSLPFREGNSGITL